LIVSMPLPLPYDRCRYQASSTMPAVD